MTQPDEHSTTGVLPGDLGGVGRAPHNLLHRMYAVAYALIDANPTTTRVLATEASSLAYRYLCDFPPAQPWRLLGVEYDTGDGLVDVAWVNGTTGEVFFDELKTSRVLGAQAVSAPWVAQATKYTTAGCARFGASFSGTRLLLLSTRVSLHVREGHRPRPIQPTATQPLRSSVSGRSRMAGGRP